MQKNKCHSTIPVQRNTKLSIFVTFLPMISEDSCQLHIISVILTGNKMKVKQEIESLILLPNFTSVLQYFLPNIILHCSGFLICFRNLALYLPLLLCHLLQLTLLLLRESHLFTALLRCHQIQVNIQTLRPARSNAILHIR